MPTWRLPMRWRRAPERRPPGAWLPDVPLPPPAARVVERARRLSADEIDRLDAAEADGASTREVIWHLLRDQVDRAGLKTERLTARNAAWTAVAEAGERAGVPVPPDDRSWRRMPGRGAGAARAARYAACVLVSRGHVDPEVADLLIAPWVRVLGDPELS
jgi:integrase